MTARMCETYTLRTGAIRVSVHKQRRDSSFLGQSTQVAQTHNVCRRSFLTLSVSGALAISGLHFVSAGCQEQKPDAKDKARFIDSVRALYSNSADARPIAEAAGWTEQKSFAVLTKGAPRLPTAAELPMFLDLRRRTDFVAGRVQLEDRWSLSDTEVAVAVIVAGPAH